MRLSLGRCLVLAGALGLSLLVASSDSAAAPRRKPRCAEGPSVRQRLILVPWLESPRERPSPGYAALEKQLADLLGHARAFEVVPSPVTLAQLGAEGSRLRPRYWEKVRGARVLKLRIVRRRIELLLFHPDKRAPEWRWRGAHLASRGRRGAHLASRGRRGAHLASRGRRGAHLASRGRGPARTPGRRRLLQRLVDELLLRFTGKRGYYGTRIAFVRGRGRSSRVLVIDYDGRQMRQVSPRGHEAVLPSWSPRGELTFTSYLWANPDLYVARGRRARRLSRQPGLNTGAAWSPDGQELALTLTKDGNAEIYVLDRQGRVLRRLTNHRAIDTSPTWSPDGRSIAFVSSRAGAPHLWVMPSAGGEPQQLTATGSYNQEPKWCPTPGCPWIAFTHLNDHGVYEVRLLNAQTKAIKRLTRRGHNKSPVWAPDGRSILYASSRGGLWATDPEGRCHRRVFGGVANTPAWSR